MSSQFHYPECTKGDHHTGEVLNLVCLQPKCIQQSVICGICYDQSHRDHKIKPLKLIIHNSKKYLDGMTPLHLDVDKVKQSIRETKAKMLNTFGQFENHVVKEMKDIRANIQALFIKIEEKIELKAGSTDQLLSALEELKTKQTEYGTFVALMEKLLAGVPLDPDSEDNEMSSVEVEQSIKSIEDQIQKQLKSKQTKIKGDFQSLKLHLQGLVTNNNLFQCRKEFKFSTEFKHTGISVVSDTLIKSNEGYSYRFALLQPSLQINGNKPIKVGFKVKENQSNWLAVGICYKNMVANSNYNFNYSTLGHGAYLVSSNAGSWSSVDASKNNQVTAFNYYVGDTITVEYDPVESKVVFRKKGSEDVHTLEYEAKEDDQLHLCGLFYYNNDEIEYLGNDDE